MPPWIVRRLLVAPLVVAVEVALLVVSPLLLLVALIASPFTGRGLRPVRALLIVIGLIARHAAAIVASLGLWIASGCGLRIRGETMVRAHYRLVRWFVEGNYRTIVRLAKVRIEVSETDEARESLADTERPVLLFGRHAGEGDTLLVVYELLVKHDRGPRVVMHHRLRLDPMVDMLGTRLPNRFVDPRGGDTEKDIAEMAAGLAPQGALVIFPEGTNFSPDAREKSIRRLEERGYAHQAEVARAMRHHSAPRPGGVLAAIDANPDADIVFLSHAGFPVGLRETWELLPHEQVVEVQLWKASREKIPPADAPLEARVDWLFDWYRRMDEWVEARTPHTGGARP